MNVEELVSALTLEEKAGLCSGADFWHTKTVERLGIPTLMVSDGPHGLRTQDPEQDDPNHSRKAVCFVQLLLYHRRFQRCGGADLKRYFPLPQSFFRVNRKESGQIHAHFLYHFIQLPFGCIIKAKCYSRHKESSPLLLL